MNFIANSEAREKVWDLIKDIRIAQMITQGDAGHLYARPMAAQEKDENGQLWFFTETHSPKIDEINAHPNICVSYAEPDKNNYVSLSGTADIVHDRAKIEELWSEHLRTWFPKGKSDPAIALIRFQPESAEYWDAPSSTFVHAYGYVKARVTGERPRGGENEKVSLQ